MALVGTALWQSDTGHVHTPQVLRSLTSAVVAASGGVHDLAALKPTIGGGTRQVSIAAGLAAVTGGYSTVQGTYIALHDVADNINLAANAGGSPRVDSIVLRILDSSYGGAGSDQWSLEVAVPGSLPTSCIELCQATVNPGGTTIAALVDKRVIWPRVVSVLSTDTIPNPYPGQQRFNTDTNQQFLWNGTSWEQNAGTRPYLHVQRTATAQAFTANTEANLDFPTVIEQVPASSWNATEHTWSPGIAGLYIVCYDLADDGTTGIRYGAIAYGAQTPGATPPNVPATSIRISGFSGAAVVASVSSATPAVVQQRTGENAVLGGAHIVRLAATDKIAATCTLIASGTITNGATLTAAYLGS